MTARDRVKVVTEAGAEVDQPVDFDLDAHVDAMAKEAVGEPFSFRLGGERFTMAAPEDSDWRLAVGLDDENAGSLKPFLEELLGEDQFERFMEHRLPAKALGELIRRCQAHYGTTPGESKASKRSSRSTRRR